MAWAEGARVAWRERRSGTLEVTWCVTFFVSASGMPRVGRWIWDLEWMLVEERGPRVERMESRTRVMLDGAV